MISDQLLTFGRLLLFPFLSALVLAYLLTPPTMWLGRKLGLIDEPNERRIHTTATPRCGGLAVFLAFSITLLILAEFSEFMNVDSETLGWVRRILPVTLPLLLLGLIDDKWEVSPIIKLLGQILVALLAWNSGMQLGQMMGYSMHPLLDLGVTVFLYIAAMNAYNLIDGMDGVAAGLSAITSLGLCGLNIILGNESMAAVCLTLTGACIGFLRFNFHPARVFLGDTGSLYLGFLLMSLTLGSQSRSTAAVLLIVPLLTMGVPMIDTGLAIWRRSIRKAMNPRTGKGVASADKDHLHHRLARKGFTQRRVAMLLYGLQALFFLVGLLWVFLQSYRMAIFTVAFFVGSYVLLRYLASLEMTDSGKWILDGFRRPGGVQLYRSFMPLMDVAVLSASLAILAWLLADDYSTLALNRIIRETAAPVIGGPVILFWAVKFYRMQWIRARALDYFYLGLISVTGVMVGVAISPIPLQHSLRHTITFILIILSISVPVLMFLRVFPRLVQDMLHFHERSSSPTEDTSLPRVLIYGAGYGFTLITRAESFDDSSRRRQYKLLGLLDDDPHLKGRVVHGYSVLGSIDDLEPLCRSLDIDEIQVSTLLRDDKLNRLMELADQLDLKVTQSMFANRILRNHQSDSPDSSQGIHQKIVT